MATINFTPQEGVFTHSLEMLDSLNHTVHKVEFLQDVLTLQPDGKLPEGLNTTGLYFIMSDLVNTLKSVYKSLDIAEHQANVLSSGKDENNIKAPDMVLRHLNTIMDVLTSEFESIDLVMEGLFAVSKHSDINENQINAAMKTVAKAWDQVNGTIKETMIFFGKPA